MNVERMTVLDIPWAIVVARGVYPEFDEVKAREWGEHVAFDKLAYAVRTKDVWGVCRLVELFYEQAPRCALMFLAGRKGVTSGMQACAILKAMIGWSDSQGASAFDFGEDTGLRMDVFAKRVGAKLNRPTYRVEFRPARPELSIQQRFWRGAA